MPRLLLVEYFRLGLLAGFGSRGLLCKGVVKSQDVATLRRQLRSIFHFLHRQNTSSRMYFLGVHLDVQELCVTSQYPWDGVSFVGAMVSCV